jgi:antitoxin (DNA-binding transcriptional repressor) of toxin-antitoxin stability system
MEQYSLQDAQTQLQELIEKAAQGQQILIEGSNQIVVQLVPVAVVKSPRKAGSARAG